MTDKYYTPEIEEFHVGFEYEYKSNKNYGYLDTQKDWEKEEFRGGHIVDESSEVEDIQCAIEIEKEKQIEVRVKYLDQEDIESLGWVLEQYTNLNTELPSKTVNKHLTVYKIYNEHNSIILKLTNDNFMIITDNYDVSRFRGTIKNKSELQKLMKQLGI